MRGKGHQVKSCLGQEIGQGLGVVIPVLIELEWLSKLDW